MSNPFIVMAKSELLWWMELPTAGLEDPDVHKHRDCYNPIGPESLEAAERNEPKVTDSPCVSVQQGNSSGVSVGNIQPVYIRSRI